MGWLEKITGPLEQKRQYRQAMSRIETLPVPYGAAAKAVHRYVLYAGGITDGDTITRMVADLADLFERAAIDGTPVVDIVTEDPVEFADSFVRAYDGRQWVDKERARLRQAVDDARQAQAGS